MAERRMFAKTIVLSDAFLDMPLSARCLYFTLGMFADDDGFVNSPKGIMRQCGASEDDLKILLTKRFVLSFESGVIVIKHWRINNYLRGDRYHETKHIDEKSQLEIDENGAYKTLIDDFGIPSMGKPRLDKISIDKNSIEDIVENTEDLEEDTEEEKTEKQIREEYIKYIVDYLNTKADKNFRYRTLNTQRHINARLEEGFTIDDFIAVIDYKVAQWKNDERMRDYIRPDTLFGTKFESYLNSVPRKPKPIPKQEEAEEELLNLWDEEWESDV